MTIVHLVTDDDTTDELIREMFEGLAAGASFAGASIVRRSSAAAEQAALETKTPGLIVVDGAVRRDGFGSIEADGGAAAELLKHLRLSHPDIPVIVVSQASLEKLEYEVLRRWDVAIWKPPPPANLDQVEAVQRGFAAILQGLTATGSSRTRRIIVTVGPRSAKYHIVDGHYSFETEKPYKVDYQPGLLIDQTKQFSPFVNGVVQSGWQRFLVGAGRELYQLILEDIFGKSLLDMVKVAGRGVDIRFHIELGEVTGHGEVDDLFLLPFEALNPDMKPENFFCARIPMARRVTKAMCERTPRTATRDRLHVLLVVGAEGGVGSIIDESTGQPHEQSFPYLKHAGEVRDYLGARAAAGDGARAIELKILDASKATGRGFQTALRDLLTRERYDIIHFYGHSIAWQGGTHLIAPGSDEFIAFPISIRAIAHWIEGGTDKAALPFLVLLSSCQSGSVQTAVDLMRVGVENVIGFRWEVEETMAADYVLALYRAFLEQGEPITEAFRLACKEVQATAMGMPVWASAIALVDD